MKQIAIVSNGDDHRFHEYETLDGYHSFDMEGTTRYVQANPNVRPYTLTGLGDLLPKDQAPWGLRRHVEKYRTTVRQQGISLRFFQAIGNGYAELPVTHVLRGWTRFLAETTDYAVTHDANFKPIPNENGIALQGPTQTEQLQDGTIIVRTSTPILITSVALLHEDLTKLGANPAQATHFIRALMEIQRTGNTAHFVTPHVSRWLMPVPENTQALIFIACYCIFLGMELDAHTAIGDLYKSVGQGWGIMFLLIPGLAGYIWYRYRKSRGK